MVKRKLKEFIFKIMNIFNQYITKLFFPKYLAIVLDAKIKGFKSGTLLLSTGVGTVTI